MNSLRPFWVEGRTVERASYLLATVLLASGLVHVAILFITGATWTGPLSLRKAATFGVSFGLTLFSIAWVSSFLGLRDRTRSGLLGAFAVACFVETALVSLQAWRGVPSHFNLETTFDGLVARTLAGGGILLIAIIAILTAHAFRSQASIPSSLRLAIRSGFVMLLGSLMVGGLMIVKGMRLVLAGDPGTAYATAGELKPSHAVMMHAVLVLPSMAWLLSFTRWPEGFRRRVVVTATIGFAVFASAVTSTNLAGVDPAHAPAVVEAIALAGLLILVTAGLIAVVGVMRKD